MTDIAQDLLSALPIDDIANQVGVDPEAARAAISKAAPALLSGMNANALSSPEGAESLLKTIAERHDGSILDADDLLGSIDPAEGEKIVNHVFGPNTDAVTQRLGSTEGEQSILSKILPMIAPFVMAWISKKLGAAGGGGDGEGGLGGALGGGTSSGGGGLGDILGGLLGGGTSSGGGGLGDVLGGLLGGGGNSGDSGQPDLGGLTDILSNLAGGASGGGGLPDLSDLLGGA